MIRFILYFAISASMALGYTDSELKDQLKDAKSQKKLLDAKINSIKAELLKRKLDKSFITHTELGFLKTGGNTDTESFNIETDIKKNWGKHHASLHFDTQYAKDNEIQSKNKYLLELEYDYDLTSRLAFDYLFGFKQDKFSGYEYQLYTGPGLKYKAIKQEKQDLVLDANTLYSRDKDESTDRTRDYLSYRVRGVYSWQMLDNLKFAQTLSYRSEVSDTDNYFVYSKSALSFKLSDIISAGISYKIDYINIPSDDKKKSDDTISANLIVDY